MNRNRKPLSLSLQSVAYYSFKEKKEQLKYHCDACINCMFLISHLWQDAKASLVRKCQVCTEYSL